jgi:hypothetical protein
MLTVPAHGRIGDATIYADDTYFNRYYAVATSPRLRVDDTNDPVFLLVNYALSDADRDAHPELPAGGGYMVFDTAFEVPPAQMEEIRNALQPEVDAAWARLRAGTAEEAARPGVAGTTAPPKVEMGTPTWVDGTVKMNAPQSARLVDARVAEAPASLLAGNIASLALDLTPAGAAFMRDTLLGGGTDEAPIQVAYDLRFWARLPPARVHLEVNADKMHDYVSKQMNGRGIADCTTYDYDHTDIDEESLVMSGAVTVQIDNGSGSLPEEVIGELRSYAFETLKQLVATNFFEAETPAQGTSGPQPRPPAAPQVVLRPLIGSRRMVRKEINHQTMSIKLDLEQRSVVPWPIHPSGTLQTLLGNDLEGRKKHIRQLLLDDPFFATLAVTVKVFTDFGAIDHAEVELSYDAIGEDGRTRHDGMLMTFLSGEVQRWTTPVVGGRRDFRWRHRVVLPGGRAGAFSAWLKRSVPHIAVSIPSPGKITTDVVAASVDFAELIASVQVRLAYEDMANGVPREETTVVLTAAKPTARYERAIGAPQTAKLQYRVRFDLKSGDVVEETDWSPVDGPQIVINQPTESVLRVRLLPTGNGWADLVAVLVDLRYEDTGNAVTISDTFTLKKPDEFATWQVYLKNRAKRAYEYRWTASFSNGQLVKTGWCKSEKGDPVLPVALTRPGIDVTVIADALDFATCPLTEVTLRYEGPGAAQTTLVFRDKAPQRWHIDVPDGSPMTLAWIVTHYPAGRDPVVLPERHETDPVVVLPPYRAAAAGELRVQVLGAMVDFAVTPMVAVDLRYDDDPNELHATEAITLTPEAKTGVWVLPTKDARATGFGYRITYVLPDGTQKPTDWIPAAVPRVIVPALRSGA